MADHLVAPHGGRLVDLQADAGTGARLRRDSRDWPSWDLTRRQLSDLELLATGGFSPLAGYMGEADHESVCRRLRLADGTVWPVPVVLDVPESLARSLGRGHRVALRDPEGVMLAAVTVSDVWQPDRGREAELIFGTVAADHPGVAGLRERHPWYVGGSVEAVGLPAHHDFKSLRWSPAALRGRFGDLGWRQVMAVQPVEPLHRAEVEATLKAAERAGTNLLIQTLVGMPEPVDAAHYSRVRCLRAVLAAYPAYRAMLSLVPLARGHAGARETLWRAIVAKNHGCSHLLLWPGEVDGVEAAGQLMDRHQAEIGVQVVEAPRLVYLPDGDEFTPEEEVPEGARTLTLSGREVSERLAEGRELPPWFSYPEVVAELARRHPPRSRQGFTVFFTGLSGSGKSTIANVLASRFLELGGRPVTLLDGDLVRKELSSELGFSRAHRDLNIRRIGFVASEITRNGGIAICAPIAPYEAVRQDVRRRVASAGGFVLVYLDIPLEVCEGRDRKGLYAKARAGLVKEFTGISDPYEPPGHAEVVVDTTQLSPEEAAQEVILYLERQGYLSPPVAGGG